jgi:hypothetical protein
MQRLIFMLLASLALPCKAQIILSGAVEGNHEYLPFATVNLFVETDTIAPFASALTDLSGHYKVENVKPGSYMVKISYTGYEPYEAPLMVRMPSGTNAVTRDFQLNESSQVLGEVRVEANRNTIYADHTDYRFTDAQKEKARHSVDLLKTVSDLTLNPLSGDIEKLSGGKVTILLNGVTASTNDLKSIPANKVKYVAYYTLPPARYASSTAVVNVVTKSLDNGVQGGVDVNHAFSTGFFNDDFYLRAVHGKNQFVCNYRVQYRNYKNRFVEDNYEYLIQDNTIAYKSLSHSKFGYATHIPELKYIYTGSNDFSYQIAVSPEGDHTWDDTTGDIDYKESENSSVGTTARRQRERYFSPSLDLYVNKKFGEDSELAANIVTTYYQGKLINQVDETFENLKIQSFQDDMNRKTTRKSFIGELYYSKNLGLNTLSFGYKSYVKGGHAKGSNLLTDYSETSYHTDYYSHRLYGEYSGIFGRFTYRLSLGGTYLNSSNDEASFHKFYLTPQLAVDWNVKEAHHVILQVESSTHAPSLSQLSNNAEYVTANLIHVGNSSLKSGMEYNSNLAYRHANKYLDITFAATYNAEIDPIELFYTAPAGKSENYLLAQDNNARSLIQYGGLFSGGLNLFDNRFHVNVFAGVIEEHLNGKDGYCLKNLYVPAFAEVSFTDKLWGVNYNFNIPAKQISNTQLMTGENASTLGAYYQLRNVRFSASCLWLLTKSKYKSEIKNNPVIEYHSRSWIDDNKSMVVLGLSWNFSSGKTEESSKLLNNAFRDKAAF